MMRRWTLQRTLVLALTVSATAFAAAGWAQQTPLAGPAPAGPAPAGQAPDGQAAPGAGRGGGNFASNFVGKMALGTTTEMRMSRIRFEAGARTNWHVHTHGQILLVEEGKGRVQEEGSEIRELVAGQPFLTKPNVRHWHGAAPDSHAVQFSVFTGDLTWQTPVTDDEYLGKKK